MNDSIMWCTLYTVTVHAESEIFVKCMAIDRFRWNYYWSIYKQKAVCAFCLPKKIGHFHSINHCLHNRFMWFAVHCARSGSARLGARYHVVRYFDVCPKSTRYIQNEVIAEQTLETASARANLQVSILCTDSNETTPVCVHWSEDIICITQVVQFD